MVVKAASNIFHWRYDGESALRSSLRCQAAVIKTIARHCTSTSRIVRTLALRSAPPLEVVYRQRSRSFAFRRLLAQHLSLSHGRRAGRGRCRRVVNHAASHSTRDRRRRRRHRALPSRPPASRRVFRDVFTFPTVFWEVSSCIVKLCFLLQVLFDGSTVLSKRCFSDTLKRLRPK